MIVISHTFQYHQAKFYSIEVSYYIRGQIIIKRPYKSFELIHGNDYIAVSIHFATYYSLKPFRTFMIIRPRIYLHIYRKTEFMY